MAASPISVPDISVPIPFAREGRQRSVETVEKNPFSQHLDQALEARNIPTADVYAKQPKVNPFVESVMMALQQAKDLRAMTLTPDRNGVDIASLQSNWSASGPSALEAYIQQGGQSASGVPVKPRIAVEDIIPRTSESRPGGTKYDTIIQKASKKYGVDADLIRSVIQVESSFNPKAVSAAGAKGMMQLMPGTAKELGVKNPFDAEENIMGGTAYLSRLLDRYDGNVRSALAAYNWGMGNLEKKPMAAMPGETRSYVSRIMGMMEGDATA
ncbi:MAG: lytic transglycosylase domain-containing protein [Magnetococcus sp. THC-1_WYH]